MPDLDVVLPPLRLNKTDRNRYRRRCRQKGRTVSEDLRKYIKREGRKATTSKAKNPSR